MDENPFSKHTQRNQRIDLDRTVRTRPIPRDWYDDRPPYGPPPGSSIPGPPRPRPVPHRRKKRRGLPRLLRIVLQLAAAGVLFMLALTVVIAAIYVIAPPPRTNILVLGVDARPGESMATRTDTIILVTVDPGGPYTGMLSIPRDLYVDIPGYASNRINAAHVLGELEEEGRGPEKVIETVEANFGVPVHRYVRLNFEGFVAIVDAAGGVTVDVEKPFVDTAYPTPDYGTMTVEFEAGRQHMDGERALQYARSRHASTDYDRSARQKQVIAALIKRLINPLNWWRLPGVFLAYTQHVDTNLTVVDAVALAPAVLWVGPDGIDQRTFEPGMMTGRTTEAGASVLEPSWPAINAVIEEMFKD